MLSLQSPLLRHSRSLRSLSSKWQYVHLQPGQTIRQAPQAWPRTSAEEQTAATKEAEMLHGGCTGGWLGTAGKPDSSPSPSGSGNGGGRKRRRLDAVQELDPSDIQVDVSTARVGESHYPIAEPLQALPSETAADTALLGFDMDMPLDLDLDLLNMNFDTSHFSFFMDSPKPRTKTSTIDVTGNASAAVTTPPSSRSSAVEAPSTPAQLWTPAFLRLVSDLYTVPHGTSQRFDRTLLLARQGLDFVISYLPDLDSPNTLGSPSPNSPLVCVIVVQQVLASYTSLKSQISSRLSSSDLTSSNSKPTCASSTFLPETFLPESANEGAGEAVYIGSFEVEGLESQCHVLKAIVNSEMERFEKVLTRLEEWTKGLSRDARAGKEEGNLAHQILVALKARLSASS